MAISSFSKTWLSLHTTARLYKLLNDDLKREDIPGDFLDFHDLWMKSYVYELPCGYIRFEAFPIKKASLVHGIFDSNPFYHTKVIEEVLEYYLEHTAWIDRLEARLPRNLRGVRKLASSFARTVVDEGDTIVYHYWRT